MSRRAYVDLPWGQVHYRAAGDGPPVVLLHDSPRSSVLHEPLLSALSDAFTVVALDTPGYGGSAPLPADPAPDIAAFADALAATLDALSLPPCPVYGYHTSSKIALELALRHPRRASGILMDGLSIPVEPVAGQFLARYMAPFRISDDASHLTTTWTRVRDLHRFFPWFSHTAETRLSMELPGAESLHRYALDLLMAGEHYADAYGAAMRYDPRPAIARLKTPAVVLCRRDDVLFAHLERLPEPLPEGVTAEPLPADSAVWRQRLRELLSGHRGEADYARLPDNLRRTAAAPGFAYFTLPQERQIRLRLAGSAGGTPPLLILPDLPGTTAGAAPLQDAMAADRFTVTVDAPGCGESDPTDDASPGAVAALLRQVVDGLGWERFDLAATFLSAPLAVELAAAERERVRRVVLDGVPSLERAEAAEIAREYCPSLAPRRDGAHLVAAWHLLRDRELNWPWYARDSGSIRRRTPDLDPRRLHAETTEILKQPADYGALAEAALRYDIAARLPALEQPLLLIADPDDVRDRGARRTAESCGSAMLAETGLGVHSRASIMRSFLA